MTSSKSSPNLSISAEHHISAVEQAGGVLSLLAAMGLAGLAGWLWRRRPAWLALAGASLSALAGLLWVFRNPARSHSTGGAGIWVAPCDGQVLSVAETHEGRFLKGPAHCITIRVRPGDVQVMRAPAAGTVRRRRYEPAGSAGLADDALWIGIRQPDGARLLLHLTASPFWRIMPPFLGRRITSLIDLEDAVLQGQVIGHLPAGGEVQVYIMAGSQVAVEPGAHVRAGETALARF